MRSTYSYENHLVIPNRPSHDLHRLHMPFLSNQILSPKVLTQQIHKPVELIYSRKNHQVQHPVPPLQVQRIPSNHNFMGDRISDYENQLRQSEDRIHSLQKQKLNLLKQIQRLRITTQTNISVGSQKSEIQTLEREKRELIKCNKQYQEEIKHIISSIEEVSLNRNQKDEQNFDRQIERLNDEYKNNIISMQQDLEQLSSELDEKTRDMIEKQEIFNSVSNENRKLHQLLRVKQHEIQELNEVKRSFEERMIKLEKVIEGMNTFKDSIQTVGQVKKQCEQLLSSQAVYQQTIKQMQYMIQKYEKQCARLKQQSKQITYQNSKLKENTKSLSKAMEEANKRPLKERKDGFKDQYQKRTNSLRQQLDQLKKKMKQQGQSHQNQKKNLLMKKQSSQMEATTLSTTLTIKSLQISDKQRLIEVLDTEMSKLKYENTNLKLQIDEIREQNTKLKQNLQLKSVQSTDIIRKIRQDYQQTIKQKLKPYVQKVEKLEAELQKNDKLRRSHSTSMATFSLNGKIQIFQSAIHNLVSSSCTEVVEDKIKFGELQTHFYKQKAIQLQSQMKHSLTINKQLKENISKLTNEVDYLREQLNNNREMRYELIEKDHKNADSLQQIQFLTNDIVKNKNLSLHKQNSMNFTIKELKDELRVKQQKNKELSDKMNQYMTHNQKLTKQIQTFFQNQLNVLAEKFEAERKQHCLMLNLSQKQKQIQGYSQLISRLQQSNQGLCEEVSKLKVEMHIKEFQALEVNSQLQVLRSANEGLKQRVASLSNDLIKNSSCRVKEIIKMHENVENMVASLQMFTNKGSSLQSVNPRDL